MLRARSLIWVGFTIGGILVACSGGNGDTSSGGDAGAGADANGPNADSAASDTDSGGNSIPDAATCSPTCPVAAGCTKDGDCASGACGVNGKCAASGASDGKQDDGESDVDCGGNTTDNAVKCALGQKCVNNTDCANNSCGAGGTCSTPDAQDGKQDDGESDIDCGGNTTDGAPKCANGKKCVQDDDCTSLACGADGTCAVSAATDGKKDDGESDIDCGGNTTDAAPLCANGKKCGDSTDCMSGNVCDLTSTCAAPTSTDGIQDGTETDIDCGGGAPTNAPACPTGKNCKVGADCTVGGCTYLNKCADSISCTGQYGGNTCGPASMNESCCKTIAVAGLPQGKINNVAVTTTSVDKYNITAGRMRAFVTATNGDMRTYISNNTPAWWNAAWTAYLPNTLDSGNYGSPNIGDGVYQELGPYVHPPGAQGANEGCYIAGPGARTYRLPDAINMQFGDSPQEYSQQFDDMRSLNCVESVILAAFCAWDGGHLPTHQQIDYVWGATTYPWGNAKGAAPTNQGNPAGYNVAYGDDPQGGVVGGAMSFGSETWGAFQGGPSVSYTTVTAAELTDLLLANYNYNFWGPAGEQLGTDYSIYIAPPGRFPAGNGPYGHSDLAGNVFQMADITGTSSACWSRSGSWQGHNIPYAGSGSCGVSVAITNKYWAMGGRCAR